jgi:WD40 repeat protein
LQPKVPHDLETICLKCLQKEVHRRYAGALELAEDLERFLSQQPIRARPAGRLTRLGMWGRRNPALAAVAGLSSASVIAVIVISLLFGFEQRRHANELKTALRESRREVALSTWDRGHQLCEQGELGHGLLLIARALKTLPQDPAFDSLREALRLELGGWLPLCNRLCQVWEHPDKVLAVAVSPDGKTVATGCADGKVRIWSLESGECKCVIEAHKGEVLALAFGGRGDTFITSGADNMVCLWDAAKEKQIGRLVGHKGGVSAVALSPDLKLALTGGEDGNARLWDLPSCTPRTPLQQSGPVRTVAFSPDGNWFLAGGEKPKAGVRVPRGEAVLYETKAARAGKGFPLTLSSDKQFQKRVRSAAFSPDGQTLVIGDDDWEVTFWDVSSREHIVSVDSGNGNVLGVAFAPDSDGNTALSGAYDSGLAHLWDVTGLREQWERRKKLGLVVSPRPLIPPLPHPGPVTAVAYARGGYFLTASEDCFVRVWRKARGPRITILPHHPRLNAQRDANLECVVRAVAVAPSGQLVATVGWDGKVWIWNVQEGVRVGESLVHPEKQRVNTAAFSADGRTLVTGCTDGCVRFWDLKTRRCSERVLRHKQAVTWLCVHPDGDLILVAYADGTGQRWSAATGERIGLTLPQKGSGGFTVAEMSSDHQRFLTGSEGGTAWLWDEKGNLICELGHQNRVWGVNFSLNNKWAATASDDLTAQVWDARTGEHQATLTHRSRLNSVAFTLDSRRVLTGSMEEGVQMWDPQFRRRVGPSFRYKGEVIHLAISPLDGKFAALADWTGYGVLWSLPQPAQGTPEEITSLVQSTVNMSLDPDGGRRVLTGSSWLNLQTSRGVAPTDRPGRTTGN